MLLLRNLVYNSQSDIQAVLHWSSNALLAAVQRERADRASLSDAA